MPWRQSSSPINHPAQAPEHVPHPRLLAAAVLPGGGCSGPAFLIPLLQRFGRHAQDVVRYPFRGVFVRVQRVDIVGEPVDFELEILVYASEARGCECGERGGLGV